MNIDSIRSQLDGQVSQASSNVESTIASADIMEDPEAALKAQWALQQYSLIIGYESAVMSCIKDMMKGIISKIG